MKYFFIVLLTAAPVLAQVSTAPVISVHYPKEEAAVGAVRATYLFGNVQPSSSQFKINGENITLYKNGAFLAFLPVTPGTFTFRCEAVDASTATVLERRIVVARPLAASATAPLLLEEEWSLPKKDLALRPGDWVTVQVKANTGMKGYFSIEDIDGDIPLSEGWPAGLYQGAYQIRPTDDSRNAEIKAVLKGKAGKIKTKLPGRLTILKGAHRVAVINPGKADASIIRTGPGRGYHWFLPAGVKVLVEARINDEHRLRLSDHETGWTQTADLDFLAEGAMPPSATLSMIRTQASKDGAWLRFSLSEKIPFWVENPRPDLLRIKLYHTYGHVNWMVYDPVDQLIRQVRWSQEAGQTVSIEVELRQPLWGYESSFEPGSLKFDLRSPPAIAAAPASPLQGRIIIVDPGHSPSDPGRITPMGSTERDMNLKTALALRPLLEKEGAKVVMTREADAEVTLADRVRIASKNRGDVYLSIHNNALPDGENPYENPHGYSVFYYQPFSWNLAGHIHRSYQKNVPLTDEGMRYGNLMVARMTAMPAVLVESAYFIFPEQEELLLDPVFQDRLARTLLEGLKNFFEDTRRQQVAGR